MKKRELELDRRKPRIKHSTKKTHNKITIKQCNQKIDEKHELNRTTVCEKSKNLIKNKILAGYASKTKSVEACSTP